jgi:aryl-alcohol dehydrogenase-like predicted oxidoreductase
MTAGLERNRELIKNATELLGKKPEVYSLARLPPDLSFEETFQNMKTLMDEGLFKAFGASEMKRESLERAQKVGHLSLLRSHCVSCNTLPSLVHFVTRADL